jgi:hypothetical protein
MLAPFETGQLGGATPAQAPGGDAKRRHEQLVERFCELGPDGSRWSQ